MNPIAWLIGLILPACGFTGAGGLPTPPPMDTTQIVRPASPNTALAAPEGFKPPPDTVTASYPVRADRLFAQIQAVAAGQPSTYQAAFYPDRTPGPLRRAQHAVQLPRPDHGAGHESRPGQQHSDNVFPQCLRPLRPRCESPARCYLAGRVADQNPFTQREMIRSCVVSVPS